MELHVAYSSDDNYVRHLAVSMLSLFEHNKVFDDIIIHVLDNDIFEENKKRLIEIVLRYKRKIQFYKVDDLLWDLRNKYNIPETISITAYARLFLSEIMDESIGEILYLDCDSIILGSFGNLCALDFHNKSIMAVLDHVGVKNKILIGLEEDANYLNSGFLFINLKKWREEFALERMIKFIADRNGDVSHHDQGVINGCFVNDIFVLKPNYNVMTSFYDFKSVEELKHFYGVKNYYTQSEIDYAILKPIFVHLTPGFSKRPWVEGSKHPLQEVYLKFLQQTPWAGHRLEKDTRKMKYKFIESIFWNLGPKFYKILF